MRHGRLGNRYSGTLVDGLHYTELWLTYSVDIDTVLLSFLTANEALLYREAGILQGSRC